MKKGDWVIFKSKHPSPRDGSHAEIKEIVEANGQKGIVLQFLEDNFELAAHPEECEPLIEWQEA